MNNVRVFIADNALAIRERLRQLLTELDGVEIVGQTDSALDAIEAIRRLQPEVVILDMQMIDGTGLDVLLAIRAAQLTPVTIILTNHSYPAYRRRFLQAAAHFFLDRSIDVDQIATIFASLRRLGVEK